MISEFPQIERTIFEYGIRFGSILVCSTFGFIGTIKIIQNFVKEKYYQDFEVAAAPFLTATVAGAIGEVAARAIIQSLY